MGEQTEIQTQPQTQPQLHQSPPLHIEPTSHQSQPTPVTDPTIDLDLSRNTPSTSKIPVRPLKLRKLSSDASAADSPEDKPPPGTGGNSSKDLTVSKDSAAAAAATAKNRRRSSSQSARVFPCVITPLSADGEIDLALHHLRAADRLLVQLIDSLPPPMLDL